MADFLVNLGYTPRGAIDQEPFTETSFTRRIVPQTFQVNEVALVLVDIWNFGWPDGPRMPDGEPAYERGLSHALRKRKIVEDVISPVLTSARRVGIQVFHGNLDYVLMRYPQWRNSTTAEERNALERRKSKESSGGKAETKSNSANNWPPSEWVQAWRDQHLRRVWRRYSKWDDGILASSEHIDMPSSVRPADGDLLVYSQQQFHRLLTERRIRVLFYVGFETDQCLQFKGYGIANMRDLGYLCVVLREGTTTYEVADTLEGLWRTRCALDNIEQRWGYSMGAKDFLASCTALSQ